MSGTEQLDKFEQIEESIIALLNGRTANALDGEELDQLHELIDEQCRVFPLIKDKLWGQR